MFGEGTRFPAACFRLHVPAAPCRGGPARLGVTVSKRVDKRAVGRNRIRRQVQRSLPPAAAPLLPPGDYVLLAKPEAAKADNAAACAPNSCRLLARARTLKPVPAPGTMPPSAAIPGRLLLTES